MELIALCVLCTAVGLLVGYEWASIRERRTDAPVPETPDYDVNNPINGRHWEQVEMCGATMYRLN